MNCWKHLGTILLLATMLSAQVPAEDPVMKARAARVQSGDGDLPPVPRAVLEPPPLPPPELHVKDTKGYRASRQVAKARRSAKAPKGAARPAARAAKPPAGKASKPPAGKVPKPAVKRPLKKKRS
jgi:hypothetical protein